VQSSGHVLNVSGWKQMPSPHTLGTEAVPPVPCTPGSTQRYPSAQSAGLSQVAGAQYLYTPPQSKGQLADDSVS
jgi:hypothetical protein